MSYYSSSYRPAAGGYSYTGSAGTGTPGAYSTGYSSGYSAGYSPYTPSPAAPGPSASSSTPVYRYSSTTATGAADPSLSRTTVSSQPYGGASRLSTGQSYPSQAYPTSAGAATGATTAGYHSSYGTTTTTRVPAYSTTTPMSGSTAGPTGQASYLNSGMRPAPSATTSTSQYNTSTTSRPAVPSGAPGAAPAATTTTTSSATAKPASRTTIHVPMQRAPSATTGPTTSTTSAAAATSGSTSIPQQRPLATSATAKPTAPAATATSTTARPTYSTSSSGVPRPTPGSHQPPARPTRAHDDDIVEITTPAAQALAEDVIDADRDKVFDALFDAQEKAEEALMQQIQGQLMITGPPSEAQTEHMQKQAEQRFLRLPLEKVWAEFAKHHKGQAITNEEHSELVRCFITGNKRWSTTKNEEGKHQMMMEMASQGLPPGLVHMMTAMTDNLVGGIEQTLYDKMITNYQLIAGAVWAQLGKDANECVSKRAFLDKFLEVFSTVVDQGMEKALKSGELDAALGPLAGGGPMVMVAAIPLDEMMMSGMGMGMGMGGPLLLGGPPEMRAPQPPSRQAAYSSAAGGYGPSGGYPSASAYGGGQPQYSTPYGGGQGMYNGGGAYGGGAPYGTSAGPSYSSYGGGATGGAYGHPGYGGGYY